jgi:hypothetical protein
MHRTTLDVGQVCATEGRKQHTPRGCTNNKNRPLVSVWQRSNAANKFTQRHVQRHRCKNASHLQIGCVQAHIHLGTNKKKQNKRSKDNIH